jgi:hypothetical protein
MCETNVFFPSSSRRGGRDNNKISRSLVYGADGVVFKYLKMFWCLITTPSPLLEEEGKDQPHTLPQVFKANDR